MVFFQLSNYSGGLQARGDRPGPRHTFAICQKMLKTNQYVFQPFWWTKLENLQCSSFFPKVVFFVLLCFSNFPTIWEVFGAWAAWPLWPWPWRPLKMLKSWKTHHKSYKKLENVWTSWKIEGFPICVLKKVGKPVVFKTFWQMVHRVPCPCPPPLGPEDPQNSWKVGKTP